MRVALVLGVIGNVLRVFSLAFLPPLALAMVQGDYDVAGAFAFALFVSAAVGSGLARWFERAKFLHRTESLAVVSGTWLFVAAVGAVPYLFHGLGPLDSFFESMSGFTTTGATILQDFSLYGDAFYLWRAMTQWFGGLGVIALFVVILPRLGIAGRQLFFTEASGAPSEAVSPQVRIAARRLWILYVALTAVLATLLSFAGMTVYEGVVHALTTLSAGGFSPNGQSIAGYASAEIEWILVVFMIIAGTSYPLQLRAIAGQPGALLRDGEFRAYLGFCVLASFGLAVVRGGLDLEALRVSAFQVASLASSTGYASTDFELWSQPAKMVLVVVMLVGGCAGSACGGPKVIRYLLLGKFIGREMNQSLHPRAVIPVRYKGRIIDSRIMRSVVTLIVLYLAGYLIVGTALVVIDGCSMDEGMSAALGCLGNIGPAFGRAGPMGNFAHFSPGSKVILSLAMWLGRLEVFAVLALFQPDVWRNMRFRGNSDRVATG